MFLTTQLAEMGIPMVIVVNMMDVAMNRGLVLNLSKLEDEFNVPVYPLTAVSAKSCSKFVWRHSNVLKNELRIPTQMRHTEKVERAIDEYAPQFASVAERHGVTNRCAATQYFMGPKNVMELAEKLGVVLNRKELTQKPGEEPEFAMADSRYVYIQNVASNVTEAFLQKVTHTDKLDKIFLNRVLGIPLFLLSMYLVFLFAVNIGATLGYSGVAANYLVYLLFLTNSSIL